MGKISKNDTLNLIARLINQEHDKYAELKQKLLSNKIDGIQNGQEVIKVLSLISEARKELLEQLYKEIQAM